MEVQEATDVKMALEYTGQPSYKMKCEPCGYWLESQHFNAVRHAMVTHYLKVHVLYGDEEVRQDGTKECSEQTGSNHEN